MQVSIIWQEDKRQITVLLGENHACELLPPQVIYQGKTEKCHPKDIHFPDEFDITHSDTHWSTEETMIRWVDTVLKPYLQKTRKKLDAPDQRGILILDIFKAHQCTDFLDGVRDLNMQIIFVPASCTDDLQPLDVSGNKIFKSSLSESFGDWYTSQVVDGLEAGEDVASAKVDLRLSLLKPLHANWLIKAYDHLKTQRDGLATGWRKSGLTKCILDARLTQLTQEEEVTRL